MPPGELIASATWRMALAFASAIDRIAAACPCAVLISACLTPSDWAMAAARAPAARLICCCCAPSEVAITARFSRSAVICACIACRISFGGVTRYFSAIASTSARRV